MKVASFRRLEFIFDIGDGPRVLSFIDFSPHISFGIPKSFQFQDSKVEPNSENYERITVHNDGRVKTHIPFAKNNIAPWDGQYTPLAKWDGIFTMKEELYWGTSHLNTVRTYLTKPKASGADTYQVVLTLPSGIEGTVINFSLLHSLTIDTIKKMPQICDPNICTWSLVDSWPHILVSIANLKMS